MARDPGHDLTAVDIGGLAECYSPVPATLCKISESRKCSPVLRSDEDASGRSIDIDPPGSGWILTVVAFAMFTDSFLYGTCVPLLPRLIKNANIADHLMTHFQSLLSVAAAAGILVSTPIYGYVSDTLLRERRLCMISGSVAYIASVALFILADHMHSFTMLSAARFVKGFAITSNWVVGLAILSDTFPNTRLGRAVGIAITCQTLGKLAGILLGGWISDLYSPIAPFVLVFIMGLMDFAGRVSINPPKPRPSDTRLPAMIPAEALKATSKNTISQSYAQSINTDTGLVHDSDDNTGHTAQKPALKALYTNRDVALTLMAVLIVTVSATSVEAFVPLWMFQDLKFAESKIGTLVLTFSLPQLFMTLPVGYLADHISRRKIIAFGLFFHAVTVPLVAFVSLPLAIACCGLAYGCARSFLRTPVFTRLSSILDGSGFGGAYATVYAMMNITSSIGMIFGPLMIATIKQVSSFKAALLTIGISSLLLAPIYLVLGREYHPAASVSS